MIGTLIGCVIIVAFYVLLDLHNRRQFKKQMARQRAKEDAYFDWVYKMAEDHYEEEAT